MLVFDSVTTAFDNVWLARRVGHDAYSWELVSFMDMACVSFVQTGRMPLVASLFPMCSHSRRFLRRYQFDCFSSARTDPGFALSV